MLAVLMPGVGEPVELVERPVPQPGPGQALVRVEACGVCGSDLFLHQGGFGAEKLPRVPGHEAAGVVEALGPGTEGPAPGTRVALYYIDAPPDGTWSRAGRENLDPDLTRMGVDIDGAFAEYVVRPVHTLVVPPAPVDPIALAVLTDAVGTPYHALVRVAGVRRGETVLVIGVGGVGSNAVQLARHLGARVAALTRSDAKLALARELGAEVTVAARGDGKDPARVVAALGAAPDVVVQCVGSPRQDELAIACAGPGARIVLVGASADPFAVTSVALIWKELAVLGSRGFTRADVVEVVDLYLSGAVTVEHLTGGVRPLEQAGDALEDLRAGRGLRSVLAP
jgi:alcohol dehydrogenase, propanol-preferring